MEQILALDLNEKNTCLACFSANDNENTLSFQWKEFLFHPLVCAMESAYPDMTELSDMRGLFLDLVRKKAEKHGFSGHIDICVTSNFRNPKNTKVLIDDAADRDLGFVPVNQDVADLLSMSPLTYGRYLIIDQRYADLRACCMENTPEGIRVIGAHDTDYGWKKTYDRVMYIVMQALIAVNKQIDINVAECLKSAQRELVKNLPSILDGSLRTLKVPHGDGHHLELDIPEDFLKGFILTEGARMRGSTISDDASIPARYFREADRILLTGTGTALNLLRDRILEKVPEAGSKMLFAEPWCGTLLGAAIYMRNGQAN